MLYKRQSAACFRALNQHQAWAPSLMLAAIIALLLLLATPGRAENIALPELGDSSAGLMSPNEEYQLGQAWLRMFRASVPLNDDPLLYEYLENLLFKLASYSELENKRLDMVVVSNPTINAFAVPGGVIGLHTGLLIHAKTEGQLASVLAHEIGHLSQRHFARRVEASKQTNIVSLAGLLAGIVLAASGGGDAATAAIMSSQAAALDTRLRYSRMHEREADRVGIKTITEAGYPATAVAEMFNVMLDASRLYGNNIPEFLLTHPVTESRVAESRNRARQMPINPYQPSMDFALLKARVIVLGEQSASDSIKQFTKALQQAEKPVDENNINGSAINSSAARYGLALAYYRDRQWQKAKKTLQPLLKQVPGRIAWTLLDIEIDIAEGKTKAAEQRLRDLNALIPNNYAIGMLLAKTLQDNRDYSSAQKVLQNLAEARPQQADIWYQLAEVHGQAGDIISLHQARAEYFILNANFGMAKRQLGYALQISKNNYLTSEKIKERLRVIKAMEQADKGL